MPARVTISLVPVAVDLDAGDGSPSRLLGLCTEAGTWVSKQVRGGSSIRDTAEMMAGRAIGAAGLGTGEASDALHRVTFLLSENDSVHLILTMSLPVSAPRSAGSTAAPTPSSQWCDLLSVAASDEVAAEVVEYWQRTLAYRTSVFSLLPRYWTTSQARMVYDAVWGAEQNSNAFQKWLHTGANQELLEEVDEATVRGHVQEISDEMWRRQSPPATGLAMSDLTGGLVGTSPAALRLLKTVPQVQQTSAIVGGIVAFQSAKPFGRPPKWYRARNAMDQYLPAPYRERPSRPYEESSAD